MTEDEKKKIYAALSAPFPEEAVERTDGRVTGRGYSTTGIKYQYVVNRLNEVLGPGCFRAHRTLMVKTITTPKGRTAYETICDLTLELGTWGVGDGRDFKVWAEALADGGHTSFSEADARKGAYTKAFKKAAAFFGVGKQAYEGTIDDDNLPEVNVEDRSSEHDVRPGVPNVPARPQHAYDGPARPGVPVHATSAVPSVPGPAVPAGQGRNRLTSKQLAAIWALARKLGFQQATFRQDVKKSYGCQPEFLDRIAASDLIGRLTAKTMNGSENGEVPHGAA